MIVIMIYLGYYYLSLFFRMKHRCKENRYTVKACQERSNTSIQMLKQSIWELEDGKRGLQPNAWAHSAQWWPDELFCFWLAWIWMCVCVCQENVSWPSIYKSHKPPSPYGIRQYSVEKERKIMLRLKYCRLTLTFSSINIMYYHPIMLRRS